MSGPEIWAFMNPFREHIGGAIRKDTGGDCVMTAVTLANKVERPVTLLL